MFRLIKAHSHLSRLETITLIVSTHDKSGIHIAHNLRAIDQPNPLPLPFAESDAVNAR